MYLFAYGTLQPAANLSFFERNELTQWLTLYCRGTVGGELVHVRNSQQHIDYPGLVQVRTATSTSIVLGTVFEVINPEAAFLVMDAYEEFNPKYTTAESNTKNFYQRRELPVQTELGELIMAQVYVLNKNSDYYKKDFITEIGPVKNGDWLSYLDLQ